MKLFFKWVFPHWFIDHDLRQEHKREIWNLNDLIRKLEYDNRFLFAENNQLKTIDAVRKDFYETPARENIELRERLRICVNGEVPKSAYEDEHELKLFLAELISKYNDGNIEILIIMNDWDTAMDAKSVLDRIKNQVKH